MVREIIEADTLPDYRLILDETDKAVFYTKDARRLVAGLAKSSVVLLPTEASQNHCAIPHACGLACAITHVSLWIGMCYHPQAYCAHPRAVKKYHLKTST
jgi:hypothetical protein